MTATVNATPLGVEVEIAGLTFAADVSRYIIADALDEDDRPQVATVLRGDAPTALALAALAHYDASADVYDIASEFGRIYPDAVDESTAENGQQMAGYRGYDRGDEDEDGEPLISVGECADGGNVGECVLCIRESDAPLAVAALRAESEGAGYFGILDRLRSVGVIERRAV